MSLGDVFAATPMVESAILQLKLENVLDGSLLRVPLKFEANILLVIYFDCTSHPKFLRAFFSILS